MLHLSIFYQNKSILKYYVTIRKLEQPPNKIYNFDIAKKKNYMYITARYACCMPKVHSNLFGPLWHSREWVKWAHYYIFIFFSFFFDPELVVLVTSSISAANVLWWLFTFLFIYGGFLLRIETLKWSNSAA